MNAIHLLLLTLLYIFLHSDLGFFSLFDLDESSDEDIWSSPLATHKKVKLSPIEELRLFIGRVKKSQSEEELLITREKSFISQVLRRYKNPRFDLGCNLCVAFRSSGTYELGADAGGPTTEFFYNLMKELQSGGFNGIKFLEGEIGHLTPKLDYDLLSSSVFEIVGKMILHSVLNNCRGLAGLSPAVISYILSGSRDTVLEYLTVDDVPDPCLCNNLKEVCFKRFVSIKVLSNRVRLFHLLSCKVPRRFQDFASSKVIQQADICKVL